MNLDMTTDYLDFLFREEIKMFLPAVFVSAFPCPRAALRAVGINDGEADIALGVSTSYPLILVHTYEELQFRIGIILSELEDGTIYLWLCNPEMVAETPEAARLAFVDDFLRGILDGEDSGEPPTITVFQLPQEGFSCSKFRSDQTLNVSKSR